MVKWSTACAKGHPMTVTRTARKCEDCNAVGGNAVGGNAVDDRGAIGR